MNSSPETPHTAARRLAADVLHRGFELEALHTYTCADGSPLYWRIRAKNPINGEKWIRPMRLQDTRFRLGEPIDTDGQPLSLKPLYRLHELANLPGATVIVTEGEHKADQLAALGLLVTTSGAADSASKADWQPLRGRDVLIWPDHDEAGQRYSLAVQAALASLDCHVSVLDVTALGLAAKEDAADWLIRHPQASAQEVMSLPWLPVPTSTDLAGASTGAAPAPIADAEDSPNACGYGTGVFKLTERGVMFTGTDREGNPKTPQWICSPLGVIAKTRDPHSGEWGRLLEWFDDDNVRHQWPMPLELLEGDGVDVRRELARRGLHISPAHAARDLLAAYIKVWPVEQRARCVNRLGWHGSVYVTPQRTWGEGDDWVVFQNTQALDSGHAQNGTLESWRSTVATLASGNSRLVFAISAAFAGALAGVVGEESGGFHLRGKSSTGKSSALKAAASVWGHPDTFVRMWRATANGLEGLATLHNDSLLILDELSQCDPKEAGEAAYLLANGQGKTRANRSGVARAAQRWRLLFLSAGEESLTNLMARAGRKANAGQEIRLADFDADAGAGWGAFERLNGQSSPASLAQAIKEASASHHGVVGNAWLECLVRDRSKLPELITDGLRQFVADVARRGTVGQVQRVARRFGLVAVAGELASHYALTTWPAGEAQSAAKACFAAWLDGFGGAGNREEQTILAQVRAFFEAHATSRFEDMGSGTTSAGTERPVINRAGFFRYREGVRELLVLPEAFKSEVCKGLDAKTVERLLLSRGWLAAGGDGRGTQKLRLPGMGNSARVHVFTGRMWEDEA